MGSRKANWPLAIVAAAVMFVVSAAAQQPPAQPPAQPEGQGRQGGQGRRGQPQGQGRQGEGGRGAAPAPAPGTPPKPYVPLAASTLAEHPDQYIDEYVTVTGAVAQNLGATSFSVNQGKTAKDPAKDVLVLAPRMNEPIAASSYVTAIGQVVKFDPDEIAKKSKDIKVDLPPDVIEKYRGKPVILATAVINAAGVDVAKKPIPPMTADDKALAEIMKQVGPANNALRAALDKQDANAAKENAAILSKAMVQTEAFWKTKSKTDAMQWAQEAKKHVDTANAAITAAKWDEAKSAAATLGQQCAACHGTYRERMDDGTFRIKLPAPGTR